MKSRMFTAVAALMLSAVVAAQTPISPEGLLKSAINREVIDGDVAGAIQQYKDIVAKYPASRAVAAGALLRLGAIYEKQGWIEAQDTYQMIVSEYADTATAATARARLAALQQAALPFHVRDVTSYIEGVPGIRFGWSRDGRYFAYSRPETEGLWLREVSTGKEKSFALRASERTWTNIFWSPNSQMFAVAIGEGNKLEVRTYALSNGEMRVIASGFARFGANFAWSPDSTRLAFLAPAPSADATIREVHVATLQPKPGPVLKLGELKTGGSSFLWSPDGSRVAFLVSGPQEGSPSIRVVDVGTQKATTIHTPAPPAANSNITLDAFTQTNQIRFRQTVTGGGDDYLVDASGAGEPRKICEGRGGFGGDGCQDLSPDGKLLIIRKNVTGGGRIVLKHVDTGVEKPLTNEAVLEQTAGGFSPDGKLFAFRSNRDGKWGVYVVPVALIPVANPLKVLSVSEGPVEGGWAGNNLLLRLDELESNIFRVDLDPQTGRPAGVPARLTQDTLINEQPFVSPDGKRIAYVCRSGQLRGFYLMDANGQQERLVYEVPANRLGRMILLGWRSNNELLIGDQGAAPLSGARGAAVQPRQLTVLNVATKEISPLGPQLGRGMPSLVSGDSSVAYAMFESLNYRSLADGTDRQFAMPKDWDEYIVSPNGRFMAYSVINYGAQGKAIPGELRLRNLDGTNDRGLKTFADSKGDLAPIAWSSNARFLMYQDPDLVLQIMDVDTRESWPFAKPPAGAKFDWPSAHWSPDGSFVVLDGSMGGIRWNRVEGLTPEGIVKLLKK